MISIQDIWAKIVAPKKSSVNPNNDVSPNSQNNMPNEPTSTYASKFGTQWTTGGPPISSNFESELGNNPQSSVPEWITQLGQSFGIKVSNQTPAKSVTQVNNPIANVITTLSAWIRGMKVSSQ